MTALDDQWWTAGQVATHLGIHRVSVYRISRDDLPYTEHGGRRVRRYAPAAVRRYAEQVAAGQGVRSSLRAVLDEHGRRLDEHDVQLSAIRGKPPGEKGTDR